MQRKSRYEYHRIYPYEPLQDDVSLAYKIALSILTGVVLAHLIVNIL